MTACNHCQVGIKGTLTTKLSMRDRKEMVIIEKTTRSLLCRLHEETDLCCLAFTRFQHAQTQQGLGAASVHCQRLMVQAACQVNVWMPLLCLYMQTIQPTNVIPPRNVISTTTQPYHLETGCEDCFALHSLHSDADDTPGESCINSRPRSPPVLQLKL